MVWAAEIETSRYDQRELQVLRQMNGYERQIDLEFKTIVCEVDILIKNGTSDRTNWMRLYIFQYLNLSKFKTIYVAN